MGERHFFVRSPIEAVAGLYHRRKRVGSSRWERDAYGRPFVRPATIFYQLRGRAWTGAERLGYNPEACSRRLGCRVLVCGQVRGDECDILYYDLYEMGQLVEFFSYSRFDEDSTWGWLSAVRVGLRPRRCGPLSFASRARDAQVEADEDPRRFMASAFEWLSLDAVCPPVEDTGERDQEGRPVFIVSDAVLSRGDFERVDLVIP
jgi:hypothetical protein